MSLIFAHRGSHREPVENTLAAFQLAIEEGADGVELDVRTTSDGQVVVFHDADFVRLANDPRLLIELTQGELPEVGGAPVPTLDAVFDLVLGAKVLGAGLEVNVEIKADGAAAARVIGGRKPEEQARVFVSSFLTNELDAFAEVLPDLRRALLMDLIDERRTSYAASCHGVHPHHSLCTSKSVEKWKAQGLFVNTWTVNDPPLGVALSRMGLGALVTDDVPALREACRS